MAVFPGKYIHCGGDEVINSGDTQWLTTTADETNMSFNGINPNQGRYFHRQLPSIGFPPIFANFMRAVQGPRDDGVD